MDNLILFLLSAIGAINAICLSIYFAITAKRKKFSNYFLSCLLLALSVRILKSAFLYINPEISVHFIHVGLSTCALIGPFLFMYIKTNNGQSISYGNIFIHLLPFIVAISYLGIFYPYSEFKVLWQTLIIPIIYIQWFVYLVASYFFLHESIKSLLFGKRELDSIEKWVLNIFFGILLVFIAYVVGSFTSYVVGALSLSFVLYLSMLLWFLKIKNSSGFFQEKTPSYDNKPLGEEHIARLDNVVILLKQQKLYKNPNLKLADAAKELQVGSHVLSQYLNEHLSKSFTQFINESRINEAKRLLLSNKNYSIEAIGYESGFNSKSAFYSTFKKITGQTPLQYKKAHLAS